MDNQHSIHLLSDGVQAALSRSQPWNAPAVLLPAPPKTASQTLTALISGLMPSGIDRPAMEGGHHQGLRIEPVRRLERWRFRSGLQQPPAAALIYGHYLATPLNLKRVARRYSPEVCCIPVRPLGELICSLISHCERGHGPVDPKLLNWTEGLVHYQDLDLSDRFELLSSRYLPLIQSLIDGWIHTAAVLGIPCLLVPFSSVTRRQQQLAQEIAPMLASTLSIPVALPSQSERVSRNRTTIPRVQLNDINPDALHRVERLANLLFCSDASPLRDLHRYLLQDFRSQSEAPETPLLWRFSEGRCDPLPRTDGSPVAVQGFAR